MSLIATYWAGSECPVILGDLLLSSRISRSKKVSLPTVGELPSSLAPADGYHIAGIAQKVCILNPRLIVAWCGQQIVGKSVLRAMKDHFSNRHANRESIMNFLESQFRSLTAAERQGLAFTGLCVSAVHDDMETPKTLATFACPPEVFRAKVNGFGDVFVAGSGAGKFWSLLHQMDSVDSLNRDQVLGPIQRAIGGAIGLAATTIVEEQRSGATLDLLYGGGIEVATFTGALEKIGDILYVDWDYSAERGALRLQPILLKVDYIGQHLVVRRVVVGKAGNTFEIYVINPLDTNAFDTAKFAELPDLNARYVCNTVVMHYEDATGVMPVVSATEDRKGPLMLRKEGDSLRVSLNDEHFSRLLTTCKDVCRKQ